MQKQSNCVVLQACRPLSGHPVSEMTQGDMRILIVTVNFLCCCWGEGVGAVKLILKPNR